MKNLYQPINQFQKFTIIISIVLLGSFKANSFATVSSRTMDKFMTSNDTTASSNINPIQDSVLAVADKMPEYPGGKDARFKFLADNVLYPVDAKDKKQQGRVIVQFVVSKTGKVKNAKVVKSISPALDKEALRVVNSFPDWIPGEQNGIPVDVYQLVPISFTLDETGIIEIKEKIKDTSGNHIYQVIEIMPEFPGGEKKLFEFIEKNIKYPINAKRKGIHGSVIVRFVVNSTGNIDKGEIMRSLDPDCDKEALRVIGLFPTWIPGKQHGADVSVYYALPIRF